ncbi:MAG: hypothetical protein JRI68_22175 [Deltaproteobacteria bacterium]|nr:hypothetical protein [Deltaproteobacteria bacterium]
MAPFRIALSVALTLVVGALGCTTTRDAAVPLVRVHAAKDLKCPDDKIEVEPLLGGQYLAKGCGRRMTYHSVCEHLSCEVGQAGEDAPAWRGRPEPGDPH